MSVPNIHAPGSRYYDMIEMRREAVLAVVRRKPGLTAPEIGADLGWRWCVMDDLKKLRDRGLVSSARPSWKVVLWFEVIPPAMPLVWEGDQA